MPLPPITIPILYRVDSCHSVVYWTVYSICLFSFINITRKVFRFYWQKLGGGVETTITNMCTIWDRESKNLLANTCECMIFDVRFRRMCFVCCDFEAQKEKISWRRTEFAGHIFFPSVVRKKSCDLWLVFVFDSPSMAAIISVDLWIMNGNKEIHYLSQHYLLFMHEGHILVRKCILFSQEWLMGPLLAYFRSSSSSSCSYPSLVKCGTSKIIISSHKTLLPVRTN